MTAQQVKPRVLVIGLNPYRVPGPWDPEPVAQAIEAGMTKFANHGVSAQSCLFGLDSRDNPEEMVTAALQFQPWECVIIGGGVRMAEVSSDYSSGSSTFSADTPQTLPSPSTPPHQTPTKQRPLDRRCGMIADSPLLHHR